MGCTLPSCCAELCYAFPTVADSMMYLWIIISHAVLFFWVKMIAQHSRETSPDHVLDTLASINLLSQMYVDCFPCSDITKHLAAATCSVKSELPPVCWILGGLTNVIATA